MTAGILAAAGLAVFVGALVQSATGFGPEPAPEVAHGLFACSLTEREQGIARDDHALPRVGHADLAATEIKLQGERRVEARAHHGLSRALGPQRKSIGRFG